MSHKLIFAAIGLGIFIYMVFYAVVAIARDKVRSVWPRPRRKKHRHHDRIDHGSPPED